MTLVFDLSHDHHAPLSEVTALIGGKAAHLAVMTTELKLPVPPGFVVTTEACRAYLAGGWPDGLDDELRAHMVRMEQVAGRRFGDPDNPLLVSVRSGAPVSMPGMMDTILDLGLTPACAAGLSRQAGDEAFGADCLARFTAMFAAVVGEPAPEDPWLQLRGAVEAVFRSWNSERARAYRAVEGIPDELGTAVTVQAMVFGNQGSGSGTGVLFTRDPSTGEKVLFGDVMFGAQGEDVVAGTHQTEPLSVLDERMPVVAAELRQHVDVLERHYADMCDVEFTIERGTLWLLQCRIGKRSPQAALRMAVEMAEEGGFPLTRVEAVQRVRKHLVDPPTTWVGRPDDLAPLTRGLPASPGLATGEVVVSPAQATELAEAGRPVLLVRAETSPEDVPAMAKSVGVLTSKGGLASHAAVVARGWGIPAVVGAAEVTLGPDSVTIAGVTYPLGTELTVDGSTGEVFLGSVAGQQQPVPEAVTLLAWAGELGIEIGAEQPEAAAPVEPDPAGKKPETVSDGDVLAALFVKTIATPDLLAAALLGTAEELQPRLEALAAAGLVTLSAGMVRLTDSGNARAQQQLDAERSAWGSGAVAALDGFVPLDQRMKATVTAWQMRDVDGEQVVNDHSEPGYDAGVLAQLAGLHADTAGWLRSLNGSVSRFRLYLARLERAMAAVDAGDHRFVSSPRFDSYHSVWFDLHEDLIRLAGRTREEETAAGRA